MQELKEAQPEAIYKADSAGRGYRKVVASPLPISILEHKLISTLVEQKYHHCMWWWRCTCY